MPPMDVVLAHAAPIFTSVFCPALVAVVAHWLKKRMDAEDRLREADRAKQEAMERGIRSLLRSELVSSHREWVEEKGWITLEAREYVQRTYEAYHDLGGNGIGTRLYEEIMSLQTKE